MRALSHPELIALTLSVMLSIVKSFMTRGTYDGDELSILENLVTEEIKRKVGEVK